jgi:hypothetical protein
MYLNLRRQPGYRPVSSKVGDHLRILLGVVVHFFLVCALNRPLSKSVWRIFGGVDELGCCEEGVYVLSALFYAGGAPG